MGCGLQLPKSNSPKSIESKAKTIINSNSSVKTSAENIEQAACPSKILKACQKIDLITSDGTKIIEDYQLLLSLEINCAEEFRNIKELSSTFYQYYQNFKISVHASCISNFTMVKGLKVNLCTYYSKFPNSKSLIYTCEKFPFFKTNSIAEFAGVEEMLYLAKFLMRDEKFVKDLLHVEYIIRIFSSFEDSFKEFEQGVRVLREAAEESRRVLELVKKVRSEMKEFFWQFHEIEKEAREVSKNFTDINDFTVDDIVHFVYMDLILSV